MQLHFLKVVNIIILTKIIKIGQAGNNAISKYKCQTRPLYLKAKHAPLYN